LTGKPPKSFKQGFGKHFPIDKQKEKQFAEEFYLLLQYQSLGYKVILGYDNVNMSQKDSQVA
jgi:hypothetical protein